MRSRAWIALSIGAAFAVAVLGEFPGVNGPSYWRWAWRDLGWARCAGFYLPPLLLFALVLDRRPILRDREHSRRDGARLVALFTLFCAAFQVAALMADPRSPGLLPELVKSGGTTSYYSDSLAIDDVPGWLARFHTLRLHLHSATHPPGPILYYRLWIALFGPEGGAWVGGALVGLAGSLGVPVVYRFAKLWTRDRDARLTVCAMYSTLPALILFFPEFDQAYPGLLMLMILFWAKALGGKPKYAAFLALVLQVATFFAYNLLVVGVPLALWGMIHLHRKHWQVKGFRRLAAVGLLSAAIFAAGFLLLAASTRYLPIASFQRALENQAEISGKLSRPYAACVFFDVYDFFLGSGMMTFPLIFFHLRRGWKDRDLRVLALTSAGLLTVLIVDLTGLLRAETARVWLFLQPFAVVPAGLELARGSRREQAAILGLLGILVMVLRCKMSFIEP